ncbi:Flp family type IVb pilin [Altererythrobacter sp.]|nr:Flp family type IVb pilin [Altererythrobacter sp.]
MRDFLKSLLTDEAGATAVEYGIILAMVFLGMIAAVQGVGNETIGVWERISSESQAAVDGAV